MARYFFLFTPFVCSVIISYKISLSISSNPFVYFLSSLSYTGFSTRHRASARSSSSSHWRLETASNFWRTEGRHHHHMIIVIIVSHHRCHFYRHRRSSVSSSSSSRLRRPETETLKDDGTRGKKFRHGFVWKSNEDERGAGKTNEVAEESWKSWSFIQVRSHASSRLPEGKSTIAAWRSRENSREAQNQLSTFLLFEAWTGHFSRVQVLGHRHRVEIPKMRVNGWNVARPRGAYERAVFVTVRNKPFHFFSFLPLLFLLLLLNLS